MFADVVIDIRNQAVDRPFSYRIPEEISGVIQVGTPVKVPFGAGNRLRQGYVVSVKETTAVPDGMLKSIDSVVEKGLSVEEQLVSLAAKIRHRYGGTFYQCLRVVMPVSTEIRAKKLRFICLKADAGALQDEIAKASKKKHYAKLRLLEALSERPEIPSEVVSERLNIATNTLKSLEKAGVIEIRETAAPVVDPSSRTSAAGTPAPDLNDEQLSAVEAIRNGKETGYLLYGVTGSGKTEVYLRLIEDVLSRGLEAIVLIPEIALTYQTVMRFYDRFGDRVSVVHSRLSAGEKAERFEKARRGEIRVMIGPRSALFTPFKKLGLIVVDEFHETSYKSEQVPKYDASEVALTRAGIAGSKVVFGSASPTVEFYERALRGELRLLRLTKRAVSESALPEVTVVDMREELKNRNRSVFSNLLREKMKDRLNKGEQIMLFLNRRGYSGAVSCRSCGQPIGCPHCSVSLNYHRGDILKCHLCGYERPMVKACPKCGSKLIGTFGIGTEKVEELVQAEFPGVRTLRMDADTTAGKNGHQEILERFFRHEADVLIGTQMIVKGHDFPEVTLVGILAADLSLLVPDFRSAERTFDLLLQAEGRAGRRSTPGECVIQTYNPEHYAVEAAKRQDFDAFFEEEIIYRSALAYPPKGAFLAVRVSGPVESAVKRAAEDLKNRTEKALHDPEVRFLGPAEEAIKKIKDTYRYCFYVKSGKWDKALSVKETIESLFEEVKGKEKLNLSFEL